MNESIKNPSESIGELFLMAYGGLDPEPALTMIRDYGISGFYLSNENMKISTSFHIRYFRLILKDTHSQFNDVKQ